MSPQGATSSEAAASDYLVARGDLQAERDAIQGELSLPPPCTPARALFDRQQATWVAGLLKTAKP
jgi:hypothetical protein